MMKTGVELIAEERAKQLSKWGNDHDDEHTSSELIRAAVSLLDYYYGHMAVDDFWDLVLKNQDPISQLKVAGALIAAEIDRLQRKNTANV